MKPTSTNVIKLEVVNSKSSKTPSPEKETNKSKPPLPPLAAPTTPPAQSPWKSARAPVDPHPTAEPPAVTAKPPSPKPGVRIIPLEVKNTKSRVIPIEVKSNGAAVSRSPTHKSEKSVLNSSFKLAESQPERRAVSSQSANASPEKEPAPMVDVNRPRSVSSFRAERDLAASNATPTPALRNSSSFSYRDVTASTGLSLSTSYAGEKHTCI